MHYITPSKFLIKEKKVKEENTVSLLDIMKSFRGSQETTKEVRKAEPFEPIEKLPIDAHMNKILSHIRSHRCTVIHGETGHLYQTNNSI